MSTNLNIFHSFVY